MVCPRCADVQTGFLLATSARVCRVEASRSQWHSHWANAEEAAGAISRADFSAKISIAYKKARETSYWLRLLRAADCLDERLFDSLHGECQELCKILFATLRTSGRA
ncbi:four helix bundle protein [Hymenobacter arcticus]